MECGGKRWQWLSKVRSSETFIVIVVSIAIFTDVFIYGMIVPIVPIALVDRAGARPEDAQKWVSVLLAVYGASLLVGSPLFGWFADHSRARQLPFIVGLVALGASTLLFVVGRSLPALIIARGLQGFSAAAVWVVGLAIVADNVPENRVAEAMGQTTIALTWGSLLGPTIGGFMFEKFGYYATFAVPAVLILIDVGLRFAMVERTGDTSDKAGKPSVCDGNETAYGTFSSPESGQSECESASSDEESLSDRRRLIRSSNPSIEPPRFHRERQATIFDLLTSSRLPLAISAAMMTSILFSALETTLPLFVMKTFHWSSSGAGLIFVVGALPSAGGVYIGKAINRTGARIPYVCGFLLAAVCWISLRFVGQKRLFEIILLVILLFLQGFCIAAIEITATTEVSQAASKFEARYPGAFGDTSPVGQSYGLFNMAFATGQLVGPVIAGGIRVSAGWKMMTLVLGGDVCFGGGGVGGV
ncbi:hypothetical protein N7539_008203 [Penicillium diatomitis]|uniref:Major facilitator superfamily (MFS) profile domain-containing protein n=1 Tax=Penicillium diatomitis TaxID=2819901 RepID=A0A9X0BNE9_9EURO|nr:uncharacterized protein N7539_008203 [Penicillium diatomitis]KAJ5475137.1 hypothetical protein N7539_008203 [Penicillium diatomitis]